VNRLVELGASVNERDKDGQTPLHLASKMGHISVVNRLVDGEYHFSPSISRGLTTFVDSSSLMSMAKSVLPMIARILISYNGASVNEKDYSRRTPFHLASRNGHLNVLNRLVELGASVNEITYAGWAPLHLASANGHLNVINRLAELGAYVNEKANDGETPLHIAAQKGHLDVVSRLVELGASVNERTGNGETPLHIASKDGHVSIIDLLVELGASVNEQAAYQSTPLHLASLEHHLNVIDLLVDLGSSVNAKNSGGSTPLKCVLERSFFLNTFDAIMVYLRKNATLAEGLDDETLSVLFESRATFLLALAYGLKQPRLDSLTSDMQDFHLVVCDMCPLQVITLASRLNHHLAFLDDIFWLWLLRCR
jgi:ankyrin repeat protein